MASRIDVFMIGCGAFARLYHLPALLADENVRLAGIVDPFPTEPVRTLARDTGAPLVARLEDLPAAEGAVALVTTPHTLHAGHVAAALERGWHVLCDKPFVMHLAEARALDEGARRRGLVNAVAFNRRLDRGCLRAREIIRAGGVGTVSFVETVQLGYNAEGWFVDPALGGGGPFTGRGTHMADLVPWLVDRLPARLRATVDGGSAERVDDGGTIDLDFDGLPARLTCVAHGWSMWDEVRVFGDRGLIELRRPMGEPIGWGMRWLGPGNEEREALPAVPDFGAATRDFLAAVREGRAPACSFAAAKPSVAIIEEAFASARDGGGWRPLPPLGD